MSESDDIRKEVPAFKDLQIGGQLIALTLCVPVIFAGVMGARWFSNNAKKHKRRPRTEREVVVDLKTATPSRETISLRASGTVVPARELTMQSQVSGVITKIHPDLSVGQEIKAGATLIELDQRDFTLAVQMREAELAKQKAEYQLELGRLEVAKSELAAATDGDQTLTEQERSLILREPQMAKIRASLAVSEAALAEAKLNLDRTEVKLPFTALVRRKRVDAGTQISPSTPIAEFVATDEYWVLTTIPVDELRWVRFPTKDGQPGAAVKIHAAGQLQSNAAWSGRVVRLLPGLESAGRMAQVLISVADPLNQNPEMPLLLDSYVNVEIEGVDVSNVFAVERTVLRDGNRVWVRNAQNRLEIRDVHILWRGREKVLVDRGLLAGDQLVLSDVASPIPGMMLRSRGEKPQAAEGSGTGENGKVDKPVDLERKGSRK